MVRRYVCGFVALPDGVRRPVVSQVLDDIGVSGLDVRVLGTFEWLDGSVGALVSVSDIDIQTHVRLLREPGVAMA